jgi:hypothetical protein
MWIRLKLGLAKEGTLSDKSSEIITAALRRAAVEPAGLPLHGGRPQSLFAGSVSGKKAAQLCKSEGYLQIVRTESRGRSLREICAITEKGLAYLLSQVSPKQVLEELVRALHSQQAQVGELLATVRGWQANIDACKRLVGKVLHEGSESAYAMGRTNGKAQFSDSPQSHAPFSMRESILSHLHQWRESGVAGDCPLPELFRVVHQDSLTIGQFHDELRALQEQEQIYLHPWSGPLPEIPEPALALLAGHGIAYYASIR